MKCHKCGADIENGVLFCRECGSKVERQVCFCRECGSKIEVGSKFCSNCGAKVLSQDVPVEPNQKNADTENVPGIDPAVEENYVPNTKTTAKRINALGDKLKGKIAALWNKLSLYGKITTTATSIFFLLCLVAILAGKIAAIAISLVQITMVIVSILMHKGVIKLEQERIWLKSLVLVAAILLTVLNIMSYSWKTKSPTTVQKPSWTDPNGDVPAEQIDWKNITLSAVLPPPQSNMMVLLYNGDDWLNATIHGISENDYLEYVRWCKNDYGFTVDSDSFDDYFRAYNQDGYCITLFYFETSKELNIDLSAPVGGVTANPDDSNEVATEEPTTTTELTAEPTIEATEALEKLQWPRNPLAELIQIPTSEYGKVQHSNDDELQIWIDQVSKDDFDAYVSACVEKGFTNIKKESSYEFEAINQDGYQLLLYHSNTDGMRITVKQPLYVAELTLDCIANLLFNKYDVTAWVDDVEITSVVHGDESTVKLELEKGSHTLVVKKHGWKEPKGTATFDIVADIIIAYQLSCGEDVISLKQTEYIELRELDETEARVPAAASELKYDNYKDVVDALTEAGFTNIKTNILYDIVWGWTSEGEVDSVSIAGSSDFTTGSIFKKDAEVIVTYHMYEDDDPSRIKMDKKASDYEGKSYTEVQNIFKDFGFTNVVLEETQTTDASYDDGEVYRITIDYEYFDVGDAYKPDDKVLIKYYAVSKTTTSTKETDPPAATTEYVETVLTVENCEGLEKLICLDWQKDRTAISDFASAHSGDTIKLEMLTAYVEQNGSYKTRFNYTLYAVDGENVMLSGPVFMFEDVNYYDLNLVGSNIPDTFGTGIHCQVKATIVGFKNGMILLDPEAITVIKVY